jgi:cytoskeletal protein RodZ
MNKLGEFLRAKRLQRGLNLGQLARLIAAVVGVD